MDRELGEGRRRRKCVIRCNNPRTGKDNRTVNKEYQLLLCVRTFCYTEKLESGGLV